MKINELMDMNDYQLLNCFCFVVHFFPTLDAEASVYAYVDIYYLFLLLYTSCRPVISTLINCLM